MKKKIIMNKFLMALAAVALAFTGCSTDEQETVALQQVKFNISVEMEGQTRAVKSEWTNDDKIFLVPSENVGDYYITCQNGTWTPSPQLAAITAKYWTDHLASASWSAVWTSYADAAVNTDKQLILLAPEDEDGRETLVAKEGTTVSFDPDASTWTIKLVMGQPADFCKVTVEGLSDEKYHLQVSCAVTTANLQYKYADGAFVLTHKGDNRDTREIIYNDITGHWSSGYGTNGLAAKGAKEGDSMSYFFAHQDAAAGVTVFVLMDESQMTSVTKMFIKYIYQEMPWSSGKGVKIKGPASLNMDISKGWTDEDANGWVRVQ